jgi:hypothetical protein
MKTTVAFFLVLIVSTLRAQIDNSSYFFSDKELQVNSSKSKDGSRPLGNTVFKTIIGGAADTVWQHEEYDPEQHDIVTNQFFSASDGSFYFASYRISMGGFLTKINSNGTIEWIINRKFPDSGGDTSKYYARFENISELPNGDILVYGFEGKAVPRFHNSFPIRFIISPNGTIKEEKPTHDILPKRIAVSPIYTIFPDTRVYIKSERPDTISLFSMDTSFTKIQNSISFKNDYKDDQFNTVRGVLPYDSKSFIVVNSGLLPKDTARSVTILRYSNEYELVSKLVIHTENEADVETYNDGSYFILQGKTDRKFITSKYDKKGNLLWKKQPELLKKIEFVYFDITKGKNEGFFITGEVYPFKKDGSVNYTEAHLGIIAKLNDEGECEWYYISGNEVLRNQIMSFAEAANGDIVFVCNSGVYDKDAETYMQITRLRPKATSINEQPAASYDGIELYPNPTSTSFTLSGVEGVASVRLVNSIGREVKQFSILNSQLSIDMSDLVNGLYFVNIRTATGATVKPIIVCH